MIGEIFFDIFPDCDLETAELGDNHEFGNQKMSRILMNHTLLRSLLFMPSDRLVFWRNPVKNIIRISGLIQARNSGLSSEIQMIGKSQNSNVSQLSLLFMGVLLVASSLFFHRISFFLKLGKKWPNYWRKKLCPYMGAHIKKSRFLPKTFANINIFR